MNRYIPRIVVLILLVSCGSAAQSSIDPAARKAIDAGNQAWIDGMESGDAASIAEIYARDAVDCSSEGNCIRGRVAIENYFKQRLASAGPARSATVTSIGSVQQGDFVYEWGRSQAVLANGRKIGGRYLTAWQKQRDGTWKIFRNMPIPNDEASEPRQ